MSVKRIYVEKKAPYAVRANELKEEIGSYLGIGTVKNVRVLIRYDVENLSEEIYQEAVKTIFSEPPLVTVIGSSSLATPAYMVLNSLASLFLMPSTV